MYAFEGFSQLVRTLTGKRESAGIYDVQNMRQAAYLRDIQRKNSTVQNDLYEPLDQLELVIFDIETTGFHPQKGDEILSIGAVKMRGFSVLEETFYVTIRPNKKIPMHIQKLTGLTDEMLTDSLSCEEALLQFLSFVGTNTLVAHHANHERQFMKYFVQQCFKFEFKQRIVDTAFIIQICEQNRDLLTLDDVCQHLEIPIENRHHALGDAKLTATLWQRYALEAKKRGCDHLQHIYERFARL